MAAPFDPRETFVTTEDRNTGAGVALAASKEGDVGPGQQGSIALAFKDSANNLVLPKLNVRGQLPVAVDADMSQRSRAHGRVPGTVLAATGNADYSGFQTVLTLPLIAASGYTGMAGKVSSTRDSLFELVYQDNGSTVLLDAAIVGPGQYNANLGLGANSDYFQVPASAVAPALKVLGGQFRGTIADLHATLAVQAF